MTEKQLQKLGFNKETVSGEESGEDPFYYYTYNITDTIILITPANDEVKNNNWGVKFLDPTPHIKFKNSMDLQIIISILENTNTEASHNLTFLQKIKQWWRKYICAPVPPGLEDMFDEYKPK